MVEIILRTLVVLSVKDIKITLQLKMSSIHFNGAFRTSQKLALKH